jgi:hypothetical protein
MQYACIEHKNLVLPNDMSAVEDPSLLSLLPLQVSQVTEDCATRNGLNYSGIVALRSKDVFFADLFCAESIIMSNLTLRCSLLHLAVVSGRWHGVGQ